MVWERPKPIWSMDYVLLVLVCALIAVSLIWCVIPAHGQQATVYGPDGRVQSRVSRPSGSPEPHRKPR